MIKKILNNNDGQLNFDGNLKKFQNINFQKLKIFINLNQT